VANESSVKTHIPDAIHMNDADEAGRVIGRRILIVKAAGEAEFNAAFATIVQAGAGALLVRRPGVPHPASASRYARQSPRPAGKLRDARLPRGRGADELRSEPDRRPIAGPAYAGRILKGAKPADPARGPGDALRPGLDLIRLGQGARLFFNHVHRAFCQADC
jgi:hypothetical protein